MGMMKRLVSEDTRQIEAEDGRAEAARQDEAESGEAWRLVKGTFAKAQVDALAAAAQPVWSGFVAYRVLIPQEKVAHLLPDIPPASCFWHTRRNYIYTNVLDNGLFEIATRAEEPEEHGNKVSWGQTVPKEQVVHHYQVRTGDMFGEEKVAYLTRRSTSPRFFARSSTPPTTGWSLRCSAARGSSPLSTITGSSWLEMHRIVSHSFRSTRQLSTH